jgi:hypothetical protein
VISVYMSYGFDGIHACERMIELRRGRLKTSGESMHRWIKHY